MIGAVELQVISRILTSEDEVEVNELCNYDSSYYAVCKDEISFILDHKFKYGNVPDRFTFQSKFQEFEFVIVKESLDYLANNLKKNKQRIIFLETFNKITDFDSDDITNAWDYIGAQYDRAMTLTDNQPMNIVAEAQKRADQVVEWAKQSRIPTGFPELDTLTYGGWSTVEELVALVASTNSGKSWCCAKMMEAAHAAGFPVALYSPEMQSEYFGTRFDTWRGHFKNSELFQGKYTDDYNEYIKRLAEDSVPAFIIEDKHMPDGVTPRHLSSFIQRNNIKLLIIDGISYMSDDRRSSSDYERLTHIAKDLFDMSKKYGCAVVVAVQANRETKDSKDEKGVPFPSIYNVAGAFSIVQIATQAFAMRQIFDKHVFEIKLEKTRMAKNDKNILSYSADYNTGNMQYLPGGADEDPTISMPDTDDILTPSEGPPPEDLRGIIDLDVDDDVEF